MYLREKSDLRLPKRTFELTWKKLRELRGGKMGKLLFHSTPGLEQTGSTGKFQNVRCSCNTSITSINTIKLKKVARNRCGIRKPYMAVVFCFIHIHSTFLSLETIECQKPLNFGYFNHGNLMLH